MATLVCQQCTASVGFWLLMTQAPTSAYCAHIAYWLLLSSQLVCTPTSWRISMVIMLAVTLAVSFLVEVSVLL